MALKRETPLQVASVLALFAAALCPVTPAYAIPIGGSPIVFMPVQKVTHIAGAFCNFVTGAPTPAGGAGGCMDEDGNYSVVGGSDILHLNNTQDLTQKKFVLLSILLTGAGAAGFAPIVNQFPTLTPSYNPARAGITTPIAESWIPATDTLQFEWTIFPQPASEDVQLNSFNVTKNGAVVPFNVAWIQNVSLQSHCPEPATWTMLTIGFGLVGWVGRGRRAAGVSHAGRRARIA